MRLCFQTINGFEGNGFILLYRPYEIFDQSIKFSLFSFKKTTFHFMGIINLQVL